jgi:hypothetical protein
MKRIIYTTLLSLVLPIAMSAQGKIARIWTEPEIFKADQAVSFFFDVTGTALEGETEGVYMWSWYPSEPDAGHWTNPSDFAKLINVDGNIWRLDLIPTEYYHLPANQITAFYGLLKNRDGSKVTAAFAPDQNPPNAIVVPPWQEVAPPVLILFPQKISKKDIFCIFRQNNESYVTKLNYSITAGAKTINGTFEGAKKEMIAYIDLATNLKDVANLDKIHLVITDNIGRTITDTDITLVQLTK